MFYLNTITKTVESVMCNFSYDKVRTYCLLMLAQFGDLSCFLLHPLDQTVQLSLQIVTKSSFRGLVYLLDQLLVFTVTRNVYIVSYSPGQCVTKTILDGQDSVTHKLICPSSSWRASRISERLPSVEAALLGEDGGLHWACWFSETDFCSALTLSHSRGFLCFIRCKTLWTLALTEWLGLVDWKREKTAQDNIYYYNKCWTQLLLNIFVELCFFQDSLMNNQYK